MKAVTWQGPQKVSVEEVPDPTIVEPTDAVIRITSSGLCGSDLHLYEPLAPFMTPGDVVGHEPMGVVEEDWFFSKPAMTLPLASFGG